MTGLKKIVESRPFKIGRLVADIMMPLLVLALMMVVSVLVYENAGLREQVEACQP